MTHKLDLLTKNVSFGKESVLYMLLDKQFHPMNIVNFRSRNSI